MPYDPDGDADSTAAQIAAGAVGSSRASRGSTFVDSSAAGGVPVDIGSGGSSPADPVRVLFVYDHLGYPGGVTHGLTRYCLTVLPLLNSRPIHLTACFLRDPHPAGEELRERGVPPIFLQRAKWDPRALTDVLDLVRAHRIDVVHAIGQKGILVGRTAARLSGCGSIIHLRDIFPLQPLVRVALRATAHWTDVALGVSKAVCSYAISEYGIPENRTQLMYNGIALQDFAPSSSNRVQRWRAEVGILPTSRAIGVIGRLSPEKGHSRLLRQLPRVLEQVPEAVLAVVGGGPLRSSIEQLASELGVSHAVRFVGQQHDIATVLGALDVVVIPSDHEGLSYVALEALALGKPVVASDVGGLPEVLKNGKHGILCPISDNTSLADGVVWVLKNPERASRLADGVAEHLELFSLEAHVEQQRAIYCDVARAVRVRRHAHDSR